MELACRQYSSNLWLLLLASLTKICLLPSLDCCFLCYHSLPTKNRLVFCYPRDRSAPSLSLTQTLYTSKHSAKWAFNPKGEKGNLLFCGLYLQFIPHTGSVQWAWIKTSFTSVTQSNRFPLVPKRSDRYWPVSQSHAIPPSLSLVLPLLL